MKLLQIIPLRSAAFRFCCGLPSAFSATLQATITDLAPAGSISFLPGFLSIASRNITPTTVALRTTAIPEPSVTFLNAVGLVLFMRRRRSA